MNKMFFYALAIFLILTSCVNQTKKDAEAVLNDTYQYFESQTNVVLLTNDFKIPYYSQGLVLKINGSRGSELNAAPEITWYSNDIEIKKKFGEIHLPVYEILYISYPTNKAPANYKAIVIFRNAFNAVLKQESEYFDPKNGKSMNIIDMD